MLQNAAKIVAPFGHQRGAYLAQSDAVSPSRADQRERRRRPTELRLAFDDERRAVKVRRREGAADFELLADDHRFALARYAQSNDASRSAALDSFEFTNRAEIDAEFRPQQLLQLVLRNRHAPPVKVRGLLVEIGQDLSEDAFVVRVTECGRRIANPAFGVGFFGQRQIVSGGKLLAIIRNGQIRERRILPGRVVALGHSAAGFRITSVAQLPVVDQNLSKRSLDRFVNRRRSHLRDTLITLAMIIGANVEIFVALLVVPLNYLHLAAVWLNCERMLMAFFFPR